MFHGSYLSDDVTFLLRAVDFPSTDLAEKERLIQSGKRHYSEMLTREAPPDAEYLALFDDAMQRNRRRFAADIVRLARHVHHRLALQHGEQEVILASLARAGTPVGVLLRRTLALLGRDAPHYSISIIRGRGIDAAALDFIGERHPAQNVIFIDGWIGKGAIAKELSHSVLAYNEAHGTKFPRQLYAVADLCGIGEFAATADDYLIPSAILNATISGLVSRSILNDAVVRPGEFHACVYYEEFAPLDRSHWFIDEIMRDVTELLAGSPLPPGSWSRERCGQLAMQAGNLLGKVRERYGPLDWHRLKPGIGEATRSLLRRVPSGILLRDPAAEDVAHIVWLANRRSVKIEAWPDLPYQAAAIIQTLGSDG